MNVRLLSFAILLLASSPALPAEPRHAELPSAVLRVLDAYDMSGDSYSAWIQPVDEVAPLLAVNADISRNPASTIKLLTTFLALEDLGPAYRWDTEVYAGGPIENGRLEGDLFIKGYGDPYLVTERVWLMLRQLRQTGIRSIAGDLVIDNEYFAPQTADPGAFDGQTYRVYNALPNALLMNFTATSFKVIADDAGGGVRVVADPHPTNLAIDNRLRLVDGRCRGYLGGIAFSAAPYPEGSRVSFSGDYASRCRETRLSRAVLKAPAFAYGVIDRLWTEMGGELGGSFRLAQVPETLEPIVEFSSPPLSDVIRYVNKWSNNVMTRQIFLTLGAEAEGPPATIAKARRAAELSLANRGLKFDELRLDNGSGLSRETRISARNLARLLLAAYQSPFSAEFVSSLALAGIDGTMRRRFRNEAVTGQMHLKTGRLNGVFALAGYMRSPAGRDYVVVAVQNHPNAHQGPGEEAHTALLRWAFPRL